ncbi:hypothetical protein [Mariniphaga sediminis]|uniref:hypothetical protein n=1 Tax=Mariniphaga sediminis TaxID=1628158 RepID=UPI00356A95A6
MIFRKLVVVFSFLVFGIKAYSQSPDMYPPTVPEQVEFDLFNIVLYIILPLAIFATYFGYRYSKRKKQRKKEEKENGVK